MPLVVDSSIAASWGIPDEDSEVARTALKLAASEEIVVPSIFWHELRNVFLISERRGRLSASDTQKALALVDGIEPMGDESETHDAILKIAREYQLTAYDAAFVELAVRIGGRLATLDQKMASAASACGVEVLV